MPPKATASDRKTIVRDFVRSMMTDEEKSFRPDHEKAQALADEVAMFYAESSSAPIENQPVKDRD